MSWDLDDNRDSVVAMHLALPTMYGPSLLHVHRACCKLDRGRCVAGYERAGLVGFAPLLVVAAQPLEPVAGAILPLPCAQPRSCAEIRFRALALLCASVRVRSEFSFPALPVPLHSSSDRVPSPPAAVW